MSRWLTIRCSAPTSITQRSFHETNDHVIKVEEIVIGGEIPLEEARPLVVDLLRQERRGEALSAHLAELRARAEIREPEL